MPSKAELRQEIMDLKRRLARGETDRVKLRRRILELEGTTRDKYVLDKAIQSLKDIKTVRGTESLRILGVVTVLEKIRERRHHD